MSNNTISISKEELEQKIIVLQKTQEEMKRIMGKTDSTMGVLYGVTEVSVYSEIRKLEEIRTQGRKIENLIEELQGDLRNAIRTMEGADEKMLSMMKLAGGMHGKVGTISYGVNMTVKKTNSEKQNSKSALFGHIDLSGIKKVVGKTVSVGKKEVKGIFSWAIDKLGHWNQNDILKIVRDVYGVLIVVGNANLSTNGSGKSPNILLESIESIQKLAQEEFSLLKEDAVEFTDNIGKFAEKAMDDIKVGSEYASIAFKLSWENEKKQHPIEAGITAGVLETLKSMTWDLGVGIFNQVHGLIKDPIKQLVEDGKVLRTIKAVTHPETAEEYILANKVYNGIWTEVKSGFNKDIIKGNAYTRSKYISTVASTIASFFIGTGEIKAVATGEKTAEVASKTAEVVQAIDKVDDGLKAVNDVDNVISKADDITKAVEEANLYSEFSKITDPQARYEYLLDKAKTMDVSTEKNKAIFYAGRVQTKNGMMTAREMAEKYADQLFKDKGIVKLTLERTTGGKWMDDLKLYDQTINGVSKYEELGLTRQQTDKIWRTLSSRYADGTSGAVTAFTKNVPDLWKPKTIFWSTELPQLRNNLNVTHINIR